MNTTTRALSRRALLGGLGAAAALGGAHRAASAAERPRPWTSGRSANGWRVGTAGTEHRIEGTGLTVTLAEGATAVILLHAVRRFSYEVDTLRRGDVVGLTTDRSVASPERSNLLSGTAVHLRPGSFPRGTGGNLFPDQVAVLEDVVAESDGVLGWGGHLEVPDQGLLYVTTPPASRAVGSVAERFVHLDRMGVAGGAGDVDPFDPVRRKAAVQARPRHGS